MIERSAGLLVSVRDAAEAESALAGGADVIDVKEPGRGSLGRADDAVIREVLRIVASRRPVSAALGELCDASSCAVVGLAYTKWGLACAGSAWRARLRDEVAQRAAVDPACRPVVVAYADWQRAGAPEPADVVAFAGQHRAVLLIDTWRKDGTTLQSWIQKAELRHLMETCRSQQVQVALAGSLTLQQVRELIDFRPGWFAVRGAACLAGKRDGTIDSRQVQELAKAVHGWWGQVSDLSCRPG
jgi:uncharacterized protein (UPF0264 family)